MKKYQESEFLSVDRHARLDQWPSEDELSDIIDGIHRNGAVIDVPALFPPRIGNVVFRKWNTDKVSIYLISLPHRTLISPIRMAAIYRLLTESVYCAADAQIREFERFHIALSDGLNTNISASDIYVVFKCRADRRTFTSIIVDKMPSIAFGYVHFCQKCPKIDWNYSQCNDSEIESEENISGRKAHFLLWRYFIGLHSNIVDETQDGSYALNYNIRKTYIIVSTIKIYSLNEWERRVTAKKEHGAYWSIYCFNKQGFLSFAVHRSISTLTIDTMPYQGLLRQDPFADIMAPHQISAYPLAEYELSLREYKSDDIMTSCLRKSLTHIKKFKPIRNILYSPPLKGKADLYIQNDQEDVPLVVMFPGRNTRAVGPRAMGFAVEAWIKQGFAVLTMDTTVPSQHTALKAQAVFEWLSQPYNLPMIDKNRIYCLGFCYGTPSMLIGLGNATSLPVRGIIGVAGAYDLSTAVRHWGETAEGVQFYNQWFQVTTPDASLYSFEGSSILILVAKHDSDSAVTASEVFYAIQKSRAVNIQIKYIDCNHFQLYQQLGQPESLANQRINEFLEMTL